jgi:DNA polymerase-3 subunit alpha
MSVYSFLWLDTETTGLDALQNDVVQLACIPVVKGVKAKNAFNEHCQPINWQAVDKTALEINNLTLDKLKQFQPAVKMVDSLIRYLKPFNTKFTISGYNADFDRGFVSALFKKVGREREFAQLFSSDVRDVLKRARLLKTQLGTPNSKLGTLAKHFNIDINAHDALSDIEATIRVDEHLAKMLGDTEPTDFSELKIEDVDVVEPAQLHCHSKYSYTDSINSVEEFAEWCKNNSSPGFSVVDHGFATSLHEILKIKDSHGVTGVPGTAVMISHEETTFWINAWAVSDQGYRNLLKISSVGWSSKIEDSTVYFPCLTLDQLSQYKEGVIFGLPGVNGPAAKLLLNGKINQLESLISSLSSSIDLVLELAATNVHKYFDSSIGFRGYPIDGGNVQKFINKLYYSISSKLNIPVIPVSDCHYIDRSDKIIQDCVSKNSFKDARFFLETREIVNGKTMFSILREHIPELSVDAFNEMSRKTLEILEKSKSIEISHSYHLPKIDIPAELSTESYDRQTYLLTMKKIKEHGRWINKPEYVERFKKEIEVIMNNSKINFLPYFLVYEDICAFARSKGLLQNIARGSAGGSLLSYYLKIIHIDPIASNLPFERFLSKARIRAGSFPDIDLDLADRARPLVMKYLADKYGLGFAQISTFNKMKTKNAIKDAMMALYGRNRNDPEVKVVCESIPDSPQGVDEFDFLYGYVDQEGIEHKGLVQDNELVANFFKNRPEIEQMVKKLIGSIRGYSRHASAFVISTLDLSSDRVPTMQMDDKELGTITVTQYDAPMIEKIGLVKADILGIKTLTMTSDCIELIKKNHNVDMLEESNGVPLIYRLPEDKGVYEDFYKRDTDSSFQFNTELIKGYAREFCPLKRADLATMTALCRPGALDAPLYDTTAAQYYIDVRNGKRSVEYLHSDLEPILKDSNGIFCYQEEVMAFLVNIVGYSWEESDMIRSAIAKKKHEVIMATFDKIRKSCFARGWTKEAVETVCQQIMAFSRYSFNKSHSYAYGELGYITLFLKRNYPLEWWCSVLNNEDNEDKIRKFIGKLADKITPPSLKEPKQQYVIANNKIVSPVSSIKGVGPSVVNELVLKGPFASIEDFMSRIDHTKVNIGHVSAFIRSRAADDFMDKNLPTYAEQRAAFMRRYKNLRKSKVEFKDDLKDTRPLSLFLQEREANQSFNKTLLENKDIMLELKAKWPALQLTGRKALPMLMKDVPILLNVKLAEMYIEKEYTDTVGMVLLFDSSSFSQGISKKGRHWSKLSVMLSDGNRIIEAVNWDATKALGWSKDTLVYVRGNLKKGWKTPASIDIIEINRGSSDS